jgi:hypothetical protein
MELIRRKRIAQALRMRPGSRRTRALARYKYVPGEELTWNQPQQEAPTVQEAVIEPEPEVEVTEEEPVEETPKKKRSTRRKSER